MENSDWLKFLDFIAIEGKLTTIQKTTLKAKFPTFNGMVNDRDLLVQLNLNEDAAGTLKKRLGNLYKIFGIEGDGKDKAIVLQECLQQEALNWQRKKEQESIDNPLIPTPILPIQTPITTQIDWLDRSRQLLVAQKHLTTNRLLNKTNRNLDDIHVPLGLIERKERPKVKEEPSPEQGSQLYQTEYTETKRFEHEAFLAEVVGKPAGGKQIAIIGEPGAGKTTILTKIGAWLIGQAEQQPPAPLVVAWISLASLTAEQELSEYLYTSWVKSAHPARLLRTDWQDELAKLVEQKRVWLLLDGLDETSESDSLVWLRDQLAGWGQNLRVVMTCRLNQWEASAGGNALTDTFDVYRTLDYSYQTSQGDDQVKEFISKWFADDEKVATQIRTELDAPGKERIKDLVKNPLRLTLLCASWEKDNQALPETQADLYRGFVNYLYNWKAAEFSDEVKLKQELDLALGELAKAGLNRQPINDGAVRRFRFTASEISELWADRSDTLLPAAKNLGWLNVVGEESGEAVYAFYHPTFQEYFAACSIEDWDYFLPRDHVDKPVPCWGEDVSTYRVFEKQWQQVILLWIGRNNLDKNCRDDFLKELTNFTDKESGVYFYISCCLAASYLSEFHKANQNLEIANKFSRWIAYNDENSSKSEIMGFFAINYSSVLSYTSHVFECLHKILIEIEEDLFLLLEKYNREILVNQRKDILRNASIRSKVSQRNNILKVLKLSSNITIDLYKYCWNFVEDEKFDFRSAYTCYQIVLKYASTYDTLPTSILTAFKDSERYSKIRKFGFSINSKRKYDARIKEIPGYKEKNKNLKILFENFSDSEDRDYCNKIMHFIAYNENYSLYGVKHIILNAIQKNQNLLNYLCDLLDSDENRDVKYRIAMTLERIDFYRIGNINKLVKLIENVDNSVHLRNLLEKLYDVVFEDIVFQDEEITEEVKTKIALYVINKLFKEADKECFRVLAKYTRRVLTKEIIPFLISKLKIQLTDETCDPQKTEEYYYLIAYCAQNISYPEFYNMWHQSNNVGRSLSVIS
jgi:NACHT domain